jgi:hypothetical protein
MGPQSKHVMRVRAVTPLVAICVAALTVGGCADTSTNPRPTPVATSDAAAARAVCDALRTWENRLIETANGAAASATSADGAVEREAALLDGFDRLSVETAALTEIVEALILPDDGRWQALRVDLLAGPAAAALELADERRTMETQGPIAQTDERGSVGQFFNSLEKVFSLVEPTLGSDADESMQLAFATADACKHVVET